MSLATRCSACSTVFRVQKDQLKASEGWVRCGRCGTVFSALEGLFDLERDSHSGPAPLHSPSAAPSPSPAPAAAPVPAPAPPKPQAQQQKDGASSQAHVHDDTMLDPPADAAADRAASIATFRALQPAPADDDEDEAALSLLEHSGSHTLDESRPLDSGHSGHSAPASVSASSPVVPSFARQADPAARWRQQRPVVRRLTIAAAFALPLLLAVQVALHHRDLVAARWPGTAEGLRAVCAPLDCSVDAPRTLDALTVESSGLSRVDGTPLYRLQVALRNRAPWAVAMPALDVTLTDARGDIVSRRVLQAADFGRPAPAELGAGAEWSALATLDAGERRITGYTIDLFYP